MTDWERLLCLTKRHIPNGPYSDSRAVAIAVHSLGINLLTLPFLNGNKWLVMDAAKDEDWQAYGSWEKGDDGILRSNTWHTNYDTREVYDYLGWADERVTRDTGINKTREACTYATCDKPRQGHAFYCEYHWPMITCAREKCQNRVARTSMLLCDMHLEKAKPTTPKGKTFCKLCGGELLVAESRECGVCCICRTNACVSCGQPQHKGEKGAYCLACCETKNELYCPYCGVAMTTIERANGYCHECLRMKGGECIDKD